MKIVKSISLGIWILIGVNVLMAFASIWIFSRMTPAIETIINQNENTQIACEEMLSHMAMVPSGERRDLLVKSFERSLSEAKNNITENDEPASLKIIEDNYVSAFQGNSLAIEHTVTAIKNLSSINRHAMIRADKRAKQLGIGGAWAIVFMATAVFITGLIFIRKLRHSFFKPVEEIYSVMNSFKKGDIFRRCTDSGFPRDIKVIFTGINELLDRVKNIIK